MCVSIGSIITTNYGTGPYVVSAVSDLCTCPRYIDTLGGNNREMAHHSPEHYHFVCHHPNNKKDTYYLGGYVNANGRILSVWSTDEIFVHGIVEGTQLQLL